MLDVLPFEPGLALLLDRATRRSMRWILEAAGFDTTGLNGRLHTEGLVGVWLWTVRAWRNDESPDLAATMAALDTALRRAEQLARWLPSAMRPGFGEPEPVAHEQAASEPEGSLPTVGDLPASPPDSTPPEVPPPAPPIVS